MPPRKENDGNWMVFWNADATVRVPTIPRYLIKNEILPVWLLAGACERVHGNEDEDKIAFEYPFGSTGCQENLIKREFSLCES